MMTQALRAIARPVDIDVGALIERELPLLSAFFHDTGEMHDDVRQWMDFYIKNQSNLPLYELKESAADEVMGTLTDYYRMMTEALNHVFALSDEELKHWFSCQAANDNPAAFITFCRFAKALWEEPCASGINRLTAYGRFDAVIDPESGKVAGVYELNGDTPVMLFESVNLQNFICSQLGDSQRQANDWWAAAGEELKTYSGKTVAVAFDPRYIEDASTCETVAQLFQSVGARAYLTTLEGLNHSVIGLDKPFSVDGVVNRADAVFILLPWEEMMVSGHDILQHWQSWYQNVRFLEPAWRWFLSHKGMLAFLTHLFEANEQFAQRWSHMPHLPTYMTAQPFEDQGLAYVSKPVVGRLSQNITIVKPGAVPEQTPGQYEQEVMVYQQYLPPAHAIGRGNFIVCGWLAGNEVKTLAFREFDHEVLELSNERFIAHVLVSQ